MLEKEDEKWSSQKKRKAWTHAQRVRAWGRDWESQTLSLDKKGGGENVEQREPESQRGREKELGHPILAFTIARVLPEAHCPLTVGLCERALHSLSYYTLSPTCKHRKGARVHVGEAERMRREGKNYSMIYTSKPLEGHGHHVEYCGGIYWWGEGQVDYNNKESGICFRVRLSVFTFTFFCSVFPFIWLNPILELKPDRYSGQYSRITDVSYQHICWLSPDLYRQISAFSTKWSDDSWWVLTFQTGFQSMCFASFALPKHCLSANKIAQMCFVTIRTTNGLKPQIRTCWINRKMNYVQYPAHLV